VTAIRSVYAADGKFVQISNAALQDRRLSFTARGILAYVLSLPPDRHLTAEWLKTQASESRRTFRAALRELETYGYYRTTRKSGGRGVWVWEQVMSDAPAATESDGEAGGAEFPQVVSSDHLSSDVNTSDVNRSDKELNTETPNTEDQKMASRRAHASGASATLTVSQGIAQVREAVAAVHGQHEADDLTDGDALGLYYTYVNRPVRDLVAYMTKILGDAPYLDTFMANVEPACTACRHWESECTCPVAA
jgi:hypothetical protein